MANTWMVMSAIEFASNGSRNTKSCFDRNAINLTEAEAKVIANHRNAAERAAGHDNVFWYAMQWPHPRSQ